MILAVILTLAGLPERITSLFVLKSQYRLLISR